MEAAGGMEINMQGSTLRAIAHAPVRMRFRTHVIRTWPSLPHACCLRTPLQSSSRLGSAARGR
jgi:hypothetical protein